MGLESESAVRENRKNKVKRTVKESWFRHLDIRQRENLGATKAADNMCGLTLLDLSFRSGDLCDVLPRHGTLFLTVTVQPSPQAWFTYRAGNCKRKTERQGYPVLLFRVNPNASSRAIELAPVLLPPYG